ncbi:MAG: polyphosphate kinase 1 [Verrucomicrobiales bacterium]|nr:polyphosphate kinase 1 [Verrucomicrobiales bacterium]
MNESRYQARHFLNRELSWLEFNQRVLDEALNEANPLLERLKFFCIVGTNLDEFFEVRVAGIKQQIEAGSMQRGPDGLTPAEVFRAISARAHRMVADQYRCWRRQLVPQLARVGVRFWKPSELNAADQRWLEEFFRAEVQPVLTPLAIDPAHPFPLLLNRSINLIVRLSGRDGRKPLERLAVVPLPRVLPRLVRLPRSDPGRRDYVLLGELIGRFLGELFNGWTIAGYWLFRVTRNSELYIDEEEVANLLSAVETELQNRRKGDAVRLEVSHNCPADIRSDLLARLRLSEADLYAVDGPLNPGRLVSIVEEHPAPELRYPAFQPAVPRPLRGRRDVFEAIRERDILLHHPYESFEPVVEFLRQAARDPHVLAIKQTLYRTGGDARIIGALMDAVNNGKQVTAVVELRARFDEANNIQWARQLEEAGVHVVYGLVGYKIHAKATLVVRRDPDGIRRYVHFSTGNYNPNTARLYTDVGLFTCHPDLGEDATELFNLITGVCQYRPLRRLWVAPFDLQPRLLALIAREAEHARRGLPARIIAKINSLVDRTVIEALYDAARAGVEIDLIVRGICCLRPGVRGVSERIRVRSIVDRFLEHSRLLYFENACTPEVFLSSADWMPRNFYRRIETVVPVLDGNLRDRVIHELLALPLADNTRARHLRADGRYVLPPRPPGTPARRSQFEFMALAAGAPAGAAGASAPGRPDLLLKTPLRQRINATPARRAGVAPVSSPRSAK